ncbi:MULTISPECIES: class I SAM-dependent methyltransferase [Paenibacillus]|uniref:class I SAM-dependent methyltransferase n=1 Tax=Paenibacillus TaxID=44249 RepID=UPI00058A180B|nr:MULTISPECIES: class I SAM-dependent methyltransferase [Paenibacillus]AJE53575.1 phosphatidylethanolamine N-methyltransferase [Paenibacillus polymyxa]AZH29959.1 class I SAM-dependent methyltransferase [Paenibacillus sp. M-152]QOH62576.1 class I SAM-dependent methyltransferase [Paenibacillus polymyxa]
MNNKWNKAVYKIWSPIYDKFFNSGSFLNSRKIIFQEKSFNSEQKILFVGVGTGADLELINHYGLDITAIDYSPEMLNKAKEKFINTSIKFLVMDAQQMNFMDEQFDIVVGSLILSVVPNANKCFDEMVRVLKKDGEIIIFDKFSPKGKKPSLFKKTIRPVIKVLGTDIGLNFEELFETQKTKLRIKEDAPIMFNGMYRKIVITK